MKTEIPNFIFLWLSRCRAPPHILLMGLNFRSKGFWRPLLSRVSCTVFTTNLFFYSFILWLLHIWLYHRLNLIFRFSSFLFYFSISHLISISILLLRISIQFSITHRHTNTLGLSTHSSNRNMTKTTRNKYVFALSASRFQQQGRQAGRQQLSNTKRICWIQQSKI